MMANLTNMRGRSAKGMTGSALKPPPMSKLEEQTVEGARKYAPGRLGFFLKAFSGGSRKAAVVAKCIECCGYQPVEVAKCGIEGCPLWRYRPYRARNKAGARPG
jgi:hypothetical protein